MSTQARYAPGTGYLAVGPRLALWSGDGALVQRWWPVIRDGGDAAAVLADLIGSGLDGGSGLDRLADFVLVDGNAASAHLVVRGEVVVEVRAADGTTRTVDGRGVHTWREAAAEGIAELTARCDGEQRAGAGGVTARGGSDLAAEGADLPLVAGVVRAAGFRWLTEHAAEPPSVASPAAPAVPEPAAPERAGPTPAAAAPTSPAPAGPASAAPVPPTSDETRLGQEDEFGHLFESTILRGAEDAAVRFDPEDDVAKDDPPTMPSPADGPSSIAAQPSVAPLGDHDGATIMGTQLSAMMAAARQSPPPAAPRPSPARFELVFSTGQVIAVDQPVVIGRKPQADRVAGNEIPRLITVSGPNNDVSRSHLTIRADGDALLATDLGSTNGTVLIGPGGTKALPARAAERIGAGARLDLGDGVTIDVRTAP